MRQAASQASVCGVGGSSGKSKKVKRTKTTAQLEAAADTSKRAKFGEKGKQRIDPDARPFSFPAPGVPLEVDSIFSQSYDHASLCDKLAVKRDRDLLWQDGATASCHLIQAAGLQLALAGREVEKMFHTLDEQKRIEIEKLKSQLEAAQRESSEELKKQLALAQKALEDSRQETESVREEEKKEKAEFEFINVGFERAKFQVSIVYPNADLSMLSVVTRDEDFTYSPAGDGDDEEAEEDNEEGGDGAPNA